MGIVENTYAELKKQELNSNRDIRHLHCMNAFIVAKICVEY